MEIARCPDFRAPGAWPALGQEAALAVELCTECGKVVRPNAFACGPCDAGLDQPARCEYLARLLRRRVGDEGATVTLAVDQTLEGQHLQRGAHHGAAHF